MENRVALYLVTLLVIAHTALTGVYPLNDITVQSGPVEVMQGQNVRLWCKLKYDPHKVAPVVWHSPPNFKTRTSDCSSFVNYKYVMSCSDTNNPFGYYNMTIMDVQWADHGVYRCLYTKHMDIVVLQVLVPVTVVTLKKVVETTSGEPRLLQRKITCTTNCAYPAPKISWLVNDQLFNGIPTVKELDCSGAKDGQKQTMSTVLVMSTDMDKESTEYNITCTAENVVGEPNVSEAMAVNNDALTGANYQNDITVQPGPVEVKQGQNVRLWCKLKYDRDKIVPVNWQTPPKFQTRTDDCSSFAKDKYAMSCSDARYPFRYYNMTIMDVQWADNGEYRCMYTNPMDIVDLQVLVPVTDVTLEKVVKSYAAEPQRLYEIFTCTTNCAFPAPKISWLVNDQLFNGIPTVKELDCSGAKDGQKQTMSTVLVRSTDTDKERTEYNISCTAENVVGEPNVSEAMAVNNDVSRPVTPCPPQPIMAKPFWQIVAVALFLLLVTAIMIAFIAMRERHHRQALRDDSSMEAQFHEHSAPPKCEKNDSIKYHNISTSADDFDNAHNEEFALWRARDDKRSDSNVSVEFSRLSGKNSEKTRRRLTPRNQGVDLSREARFDEHSAPPKSGKNDWIKRYSAST
ncbi:neural cell adhesion molecule 1-A-like [Lineus longissimus]|uniref:neural cell adhesion molecule 1-A-like n=1 Tax=Lineus longissimus TaxID=88925 RepID=UPI00315CA065